jgi:hypothetical protein
MEKYTRRTYFKGSMNLYLLERDLLIKALLKSNWNVKEAMSLNFPENNITQDNYYRKLARHQISIRNKTYTELEKMR